MAHAMAAALEIPRNQGNAGGVLMAMKEPMMDFVIGKIRLLNPNKFSL